MKLTVSDIIRIAETRENDTFGQLRRQQQIDDKFYELEYEVGIKAPYKVVRTDSARSRVDSLVDHIVTNNPIVSVAPRAQKEKYIKQADKMEKWYQGWVQKIIAQNPNPLRENAKKMGVRGEIFWKVLHVKPLGKPERRDSETSETFEERMELWEIQRLETFPLRLMVPDPMTCYPHPVEVDGRPVDMIEIFDRTIEEIREIYPEWTNPQHKKPGDTVKWIEFWGVDYEDPKKPKQVRCFIADNTPVLKGEIQTNIYGFVPYRHAYSGFGMTGGKYDPEKVARSILYGVRNLIQQEARNLSYIDSQIAIYSHPRVITNLSQEKVGQIDLSPGVTMFLPDGTVYGAPSDGRNFLTLTSGEAPPSEVFQHFQQMRALIEAGSPGVIRGEVPRGVDVGYLAAIAVGQARLKFGGPLDGMETSFANILGDGARLVETVIKEPVSVHGTAEGKNIETIAPDDINGYYRCRVRLESQDPENNDRRAALGDKLWNGGQGSISWRRNLEEYQGVADATGEMAQVLAERTLLTDPDLARARAMAALEELGMLEAIEEEKRKLEMEKKMSKFRKGGNNEADKLASQSYQPAMPGSTEEMELRNRQILGGPGGAGPLGSPEESMGGM